MQYIIHAKEWRDRVNGNSYYSARVFRFVYDGWELYDTLPFSYGYDTQSYYDALQTSNITDEKSVYYIKEQGLTKRAVQAWGK